MSGGSQITMRRAAIVQFVSKYVGIAISLLITAVLARLVTPEEFGLIAIVMVFTAFFNMFADMGISVAIIQFRDLDEEDFGKLFVFSIFLAFALMALFCILSIPISFFYENQELMPLCCAASVSLLFTALNMVPNGIMLREKRFVAIGIRYVFGTFLSGITGIACALLGFGVYALVIQTIVQSVIVFIWNYASHPIRHLSIHFVAPLRRVFSYSAFQMGFSLVNYFSRNLDNLVIGRAMGAPALGFYDKAYKLTTYPLSAVSTIASSVIQPFMAEHQNEPDVIYQCWLKVAKLLSLIGAPITALFFSTSPQIIEIFYGSQWNESIPLFHALSISVYFQMVGNISGSFFQSLGRTDLMFRCGILTTAISVCGLVIGLMMGSLEAVSWCIAIAFCLHILAMFHYLIIRGFGHRITELRSFLPEIVICIVSCVLCILVEPFIPQGLAWKFMLQATILVAVFVIGYGITGQFKYFGELRR